MSCSSTPTLTQFRAVVSDSTIASFSEVVTVLPPSTFTTGTETCTTFADGITVVTSCFSSFSLTQAPERASTMNVPFQVISPITSFVPTATLFAASCPTTPAPSSRPLSNNPSTRSLASSTSTVLGGGGSSSVGAAVGGAIAGLIFLILVGVGSFYVIRHRQRPKIPPLTILEIQGNDGREDVESPEPKPGYDSRPTFPGSESYDRRLPFSSGSFPPASTQTDNERIQRLVSRVLKAVREGNDLPLIDEVDVQLIINEVFRSLTQSSTHHEQRKALRRLCLKLVIQFARLPDSMFLRDVQYKEADLLGSGSFADVFQGRHRNIDVAVKRLRQLAAMSEDKKLKLTKSLYRVALLWKLLEHPNILPLLGVYSDDTHNGSVLIVSQLAENGGIKRYIDNLRSRIGLSNSGLRFVRAVNKWLHQIALGLAYLHEQSIVHGYLHSGNILVDSTGNVRLTDFGLALIADLTSYGHGPKHGGGGLFMRAPELVSPTATTTRPTPACDVYSFALVCIELYTGERPFSGTPEFQVLSLILSGQRPPRPDALLPAGDSVLDMTWDLMTRCWSEDPQQRPPSQEVAQTMETIFHDSEIEEQ